MALTKKTAKPSKGMQLDLELELPRRHSCNKRRRDVAPAAPGGPSDRVVALYAKHSGLTVNQAREVLSS
jgi:hypothetical protein